MTTSLSNYGWLGPAKAVDPSGVETDYTYTPFGEIATSSSLGIVTTYVYDLAGNVIHVLTTGNYLGQSTLTTDTYATYDAMGRMTSSTDEMGRVTNYAYSADSSGMTTTITYNDDSTMVEVFYLDGTPESVSGTAVTPSAYDEGVESNGDTWTLSSTNEGQNWTKTFTNALGQQYQTQRSGPDSATETATTVYDGNGRPIQFTDFDGTITYTDYDPSTGMVADTWQDVLGTGVFDPSVDPKTTFAQTPISTDDSTFSGETDEIVAEEGNEADSDGSKNAGLDTQDVSAGQTTTTHTDLNTPEEGDTTVTTTNPDGTQVVDEYTDGRLTDEKTLGADHTTEITDTSYGYDALGRNNTITDWTGTTTFTFFADGSVSEVDYPDGRTQTVDDTDPKSGTPTEVTLPNGQTQDTGINSLGQQTSQSGGGVLPAEFTYDANTGALTTMKLFQSGTLDSGTPETTTWAYDPATGLLTSKTYDDGTSDVYTYNAKLQLATLTRPGTFTNYTYNASGQQTSSTATDTTTGNSNSGQSVTDSTGAYDDQGRPTSVTQTTKNAAGQVQSSNTNAYTYTAAGDLKSESQAASVTTVYTYYPATSFGSTGAPDALESVKLMQGTATLSESDYTYDPVSKRLATVTVNGQTFTYTYKSGTNLVESITASNVSTAYGYEATTGRLSSITSTSTADDDTQTLYSADYTYYTNDQRETESVTQVQPDGSTDSHNWTFTYDDQNELTGVTNTGDSSSVGTYGYDGAGNRNDSAYTETYGTANAMNQLSALSYNGRGDLIDDGTQNYTWDATDELTEEKPDSPTTGSTKEDFQYDAQQRRTDEDVYNWNGTTGAWDTAADKVLKFVYQGSNLVAELDGTNHMVTSLTWGLSGTLIAVTDYTETTPKTYMVVQDGTSNTVALEDPATGAVVASYEYAPFGARTKATGSAVNVCPLQYADMVFDGSAALPYYAWHRYYSPATDEWLSRDPIAEQGGLDTGEYANNDPIDSTDASGLDPKPGWKQIWDTSKLIATHPQWAVSSVRGGFQLMEQAAIQKALDIVGCQTDPVKKIVYDQGVNAGLIKAGVNTVTGIAEMQDTADDAINWLLTGSPGVYRDASLFPKHFISNAANGAIDSKFAGIAQVDPKAFKTGEFVGNAEFQVGMIGLSLVDPLAGLSEVGEAALAADAFEQALSGARATEVTSSLMTVDAADPVWAAAARGAEESTSGLLRVGPGDGYAANILEGGSGNVFAGHGELRLGMGTAGVPEGTSLTLWSQPGVNIPNSLGLAIEQGNYDLISLTPKWQKYIEGAATYLPGAEVPNYVLKAPTNLTIMSASTTVEDATYLSDLLKPNMGNVNWAACTTLRY